MPVTTPPPGGRFPLGGGDVARLGYGAMQLERTTDEQATAVLRAAVAGGVEHVDTAGFYGGGVVNRRIRAALHPYPDGLAIVSKVGARHVEGGDIPLAPAQRPDELRAAVEEDLRTLGTDRLDVVNLRRVDRAPGIVATGDQLVPLEDQLEVLVALRDEGKVGAIGVSHVDAEQLEAALPAGVACVQNAFNLLDRGDEPLLDRCAALGIAWVPFFPLGSAFDRMPSVTDQPAVTAAAAELGATPAQVGLAWLLGHRPNVLLIPGTRSVDHLAENLAAGDLVLPAQVVAALDALATGP